MFRVGWSRVGWGGGGGDRWEGLNISNTCIVATAIDILYIQVKGIHLDIDVRGTAWFRHSDGRWRNFTSKITEVRIVKDSVIKIIDAV